MDAVPERLRDPVVRRWDAFAAAAARAGLEPRLDAVAGQGRMAELPRVWACSDFVAQACCREPQMLLDLLDSADLHACLAQGSMTERVAAAVDTPGDEVELGAALRRFRRRELVRIAWRDLTGEADLWELMRDVSELAEACLECALGWLYRWSVDARGQPLGRHSGAPVHLIVLGLGKLGGRELNYSSDIDLMFAYAEEGETQPGRASNHEFFTRLGRRLIKVMDDVTAEGIVFRTDMRLRPNGESGPLVLSTDAMEHYYQTHGRDWERYALIKARVVAGDRQAGDQLLDVLTPFVYRRYLDYGAFEAIRSMTTLIERELSRKGTVDNIKLGRGGIREIEFIAQSYQLIRGGREPRLRTQQLAQALDYLAGAGVMDSQLVDELRRCYTFLRNVEHRLQMVADQQTHVLPSDEVARLRLAYGMGFDEWTEFESEVRDVMTRVHRRFKATFTWSGREDRDGEQNPASDLWMGTLDAETEVSVLEDLGYDDPQAVQRLLHQLRGGSLYRAFSQTGRDRLDRLMPMLIREAGTSAGSPANTITRLVKVVESIGRRSAYLSVLIENPLALTQLVGLCSASAWISGWIAGHPVLLDELLDPISGYEPRDATGLESELAHRLDQVEEQDLELQMETLREFRHGHVLRVAAADIAGQLDGAQISRQLCNLAQAILARTASLAHDGLRGRYGEPCCQGEAGSRPAALGIVAYGKLGSMELGYNSDLDIIFVYEPCTQGETGATQGGEQSISNELYFGRLSQRIIHLLTTRTATGLLYEIDMRLRPSGRSGTLVTSLDAFRGYQLDQAWTWEHQAVVRARMVVGTDSLIERFERVRREILCLSRDEATLKKDIRSMRERMIEANCRSNETHFDLKLGRGGIVDIEFLVQYYALRWAHAEPAITRPRDNIGLLQALVRAGRVAEDRAEVLTTAYNRFLATEHQLKLMDRPSLVAADELVELRDAVSAVWAETFD